MVNPYNTPDPRGNDPRNYPGKAGHTNPAASYPSSQLPQYPQQSVSPAPAPNAQYPHPTPNSLNQPPNRYDTPQSRYAPPQRSQAPDTGHPRPDEVFRLPEAANLAIPEEVRKEFQQDEYGNVLFFTAPPVDTLAPVKPGSAVGHTARYLADKLRAQIAAKEKRKPDGELEESADGVTQTKAKKIKWEDGDVSLNERISSTKFDAFQLLIQQMQNSTDRIYQDIYGADWEEGKKLRGESLKADQLEAQRAREELDARRRQRVEDRKLPPARTRVFQDDWDPRY